MLRCRAKTERRPSRTVLTAPTAPSFFMKSNIRSLLAFALTVTTGIGALAQAGHDHAGATQAAASAESYPLTTCVVSGDKLGEMGDSVHYVYKQPGKPDRMIQFCCKDCIKDFEKEPAKYLAVLDAAETKRGNARGAMAAMPAATTAAARGGDAAGRGELVDRYVPISEALAADDLAKAKSAAKALVEQADADGMTPAAKAGRAIAEANDLEAARTGLKALTSEIEPLAQGASGYTVMHCPMADADWIQAGTKVRNPYYGKMMPTCGSPKTSK